MDKINNRLGYSFSLPIRLFCIFISVFSFGGLFTEPILGIIGVIISVFFWSSSYGIEIDLDENQFREFSSAYGLRKGDWKSLDSLPFLSILPVREGVAIHSQSNRRTFSIEDKTGIYLLTKSHRGKILVEKFESSDQAKKYAINLSKTLNKEIVQYSPVVSEKTKRRRRR